MERLLILIGVDGAEGEVLCGGHGRLGQHVEEGGLAHVGQTHDAALEVGAQAAEDDHLLLGHVLLLGRHLDREHARKGVVDRAVSDVSPSADGGEGAREVEKRRQFSLGR